MSIDERARRELRQRSELIQPDVETHLTAVLERRPAGGGRRIRPLLVNVFAVILIVTVMRLAIPGGTFMPGASSPTASPSLEAVPGSDFIGRYSVVLVDSGKVHAYGLAGMWALELDADGVLLMTPPSTYPGGGEPLSGFAWTLSPEGLRTSLFVELCGSLGIYAWQQSGASLSFTARKEDCDLRQTLLTTSPWMEMP